MCSTVRWLVPGTVSHTGTVVGPHTSRMSWFWRTNSSDSSAPTAAYSVPLGRGKKAGLSRATEVRVSCRSAWMKGAWRSGSRSYRPEIDRPLVVSCGGRSGASCGQRHDSIIATAWPPAECPASAMRLGSPPYSAAWRQTAERLFRKLGREVEVLHQPDVKPVRGSSLRFALGEVVKYATGVKRGKGAAEFQGIQDSGKFLIAACLSGSRMVQSFGGLAAAELEKPDLVCPRCGEIFIPGSWFSWERERMTAADARVRRLGIFWADVYPGWILEYSKEAG